MGRIHAFGGAPAVSPSGDWYNWDIVRGISSVPDGGYVLDAFGGIHQYGSAPVAASSHYTLNQYIAKGISS